MLLSRKPDHANREGRVEQNNVAAPVLAAIPAPSQRSLRGLDWFIFFLADVQTGFGPFIAVYLTTQKWTQVEIGFVLSIGGIVGLLGQKTTLEGRPAQAFPLRFADGAVYLGRIRIANTQPLF